MDYIGLFKAGKVIWKTLGESRDVIFVAKKVAPAAMECIAGTLIGVAIKDLFDGMEKRNNG